MLRTFVAMRLLVGGGTFLAPALGARILRFDRAADPEAAYWARLFGIRDVALGLGALRASGQARRDLMVLTAACDAVDVASALLGRRGGFSPQTTALAGLGALGAGLVTAVATRGE